MLAPRNLCWRRRCLLLSRTKQSIAAQGEASVDADSVLKEGYRQDKESTVKPSPAGLGTSSLSLQPKTLYLVGTPIGNMEDITLRAIRVLRDVDLILCEDTRRTGLLLKRLGIQKRETISYHEHNAAERSGTILSRLRLGQAVALVTDAGMPAISDPGARIVAECVQEGLSVVPIPGPSSPVTALCVSGMEHSAKQFTFGGFLPPQQAARCKQLESLSLLTHPLVFLVPIHSLVAVLTDAAEVLGSSRKCVVGREMTKLHEEFWRGTLKDACRHYESNPAKGEITLVVEGAQESASPTEDELLQVLRGMKDQGYTASFASKQAAQQLKMGRNRVYKAALLLWRDGEEDI